ncbi:MAG: DUF4230 domain-containing protein [Bacteroidota bacterium]
MKKNWWTYIWSGLTFLPRALWAFIKRVGYFTFFIPLLLLGGLIFWWVQTDIGPLFSTELTVTPTPTVIQQVNDIGELITAEFYGEVVHSLAESYEEEDLLALRLTYDNARKAYIQIVKENQGPGVPAIHQRQANVDRFMRTPAATYDREWFRVLMNVLTEPDQLLEEMRRMEWPIFFQKYESQVIQQKNVRRTQMNDEAQLIYLGRGLVKAGYDLAAMDASQIQRKADTLYFIDLDPQIIDADINPWFVAPENHPEGGIKGYEVLREEGYPKEQQVKRVKLGCKKDLINAALELELYRKAEKIAEETLLDFFRLLKAPADSNLQYVDIRPTREFARVRAYLADQKIDREEVREIRQYVATDSIPLPRRQRLKEQLLEEVFGLEHTDGWYQLKRSWQP